MEMDGKIVIVTGANAGIGKETAKQIAKQGAKVIMACRNLEAGRQAKEEIIKATGNSKVFLKKIDLSSLQSVREFAEEINKTEPRLDVLIHNAGMTLSRNHTSKDGLELTMATNHFGPFLLTHLLIDLLKNSAPSRIIVVSSITHHLGRLNFNKSGYVPSYIPQWNYFNSKLANVCFVTELARRLEGTNVTANSLHPGLIKTKAWNSLPTLFNWPFKLLSKLFFITCEEGCKTTVYLATSEEVANENGSYFVNCKKACMSNKAFDVEKSKFIWEISKEVVNLKEDQFKI